MKENEKEYRYAIWIDKRQAMILRSGGQDEMQYTCIESDNPSRERFNGETTNKSFGIFGYTLNKQKQMQEKSNNRNASFLKKVLAEIKDPSAILILGSGDNRHELQNFIENSKQINHVQVENKAYKKINQRELELIMEEHFGLYNS